MSSFKINFTKSVIEKLIAPESGKRDYYYDLKESGLVLQLTSSGAKSFYLYRKINGRPERVLLGKFPDLSIEQVRKKAVVEKANIVMGKNPQDNKRKIRHEITFKEMFDEYMQRYSRPHKKTWRSDEQEVNRFLKHWFHRKISSITTNEIRKLHEQIYKDSGLYQANRLFERVRAMYNKIIEWGWDGNNPTNGIKKYKEKSRDRFLQPDELRKFIDAIESEENPTARDIFKVMLFTGARKTNVLMMRWEQVDFEYEVWRIPESKNGEPLVLPLSHNVVELLFYRKPNNTIKNPWVFPGIGKEGYYNDPKKAWNRIKQRAGIQDIRMHDLRRTMGSYQAISGASLPVIGKSLGHKSAQATQIYSRLFMDPVRQSVEKANKLIMELGSESNEN